MKEGKGLLVDMNLSIIMLPLIVSGVSFGVILNVIFPEIIIVTLYVCLLGFLGYELFFKARTLYRKEIAHRMGGSVFSSLVKPAVRLSGQFSFTSS